MKVESFFYLGVTAFFVVIGTIYWFWSYEDAGTTMLARNRGSLSSHSAAIQSLRALAKPAPRSSLNSNCTP